MNTWSIYSILSQLFPDLPKKIRVMIDKIFNAVLIACPAIFVLQALLDSYFSLPDLPPKPTTNDNISFVRISYSEPIERSQPSQIITPPKNIIQSPSILTTRSNDNPQVEAGSAHTDGKKGNNDQEVSKIIKRPDKGTSSRIPVIEDRKGGTQITNRKVASRQTLISDNPQTRKSGAPLGQGGTVDDTIHSQDRVVPNKLRKGSVPGRTSGKSEMSEQRPSEKILPKDDVNWIEIPKDELNMDGLFTFWESIRKQLEYLEGKKEVPNSSVLRYSFTRKDKITIKQLEVLVNGSWVKVSFQTSRPSNFIRLGAADNFGEGYNSKVPLKKLTIIICEELRLKTPR